MCKMPAHMFRKGVATVSGWIHSSSRSPTGFCARTRPQGSGTGQSSESICRPAPLVAAVAVTGARVGAAATAGLPAEGCRSRCPGLSATLVAEPDACWQPASRRAVFLPDADAIAAAVRLCARELAPAAALAKEPPAASDVSYLPPFAPSRDAQTAAPAGGWVWASEATGASRAASAAEQPVDAGASTAGVASAADKAPAATTGAAEPNSDPVAARALDSNGRRLDGGSCMVMRI